MRMVNDHAEVIKSSSSLETSQASITMTPEMFSLLSSGVYTFKERAVIRELSCNAVDTHKEAGKENVPFRVHLPTRFDPYFEVRDFGTGLTHEKVMSLYLNYGASTKNDSNDYIGAMGIGSKSPFAIAQSFTVSSYVDGVVNKYSVYLENGIPQVTKLTTNPTTEPNGLAVRVAVADHRIQKFHEEASNVFSYFKLKPECNVEYRDILSEMTTIVREDGVYDAMKYKENWRSSNNQTNFNVVMGNIAYPVGLGDLLGAEFTSVLPTFFRNAVDLVNIYMPIGSVAIAASREALQMNETTKKAITDAVKKITATIVEDVVKRIGNEPTLADAAQAYADLRANSREIFQHVFTRLEWNGQNLADLEQKLLKIRQGQLSNADGTPKFAADDNGTLLVDKSGNHIPVIGNLYEPVAYFKYNQLENKIRATSAMYTQEGANFSIFGAMSKNKMSNYLFLINDRRNKNGTEKTVGRNQIIRGACRDRENEEPNFRRYNGIVYMFSDEQELDQFISLHMLDKSLLTIVKMSDKEHHYVKRTVTRGVVKLYKASVHEHGVSYGEVKENFDDIEEPQYYIKAQSDEVLGGIFSCSPEAAAKVSARLTGQSVYVFRKANWKKIPEDWLEVNQQVFKDSITDIHWIEFNRFVTREWCSSNCDITDKGVIARTFQFGDKKCSRGYVYSADYSKRIFLEGNEEAVEAMFGKLAYVASPIAYKDVTSVLHDLQRLTRAKSKVHSAIYNARERIKQKLNVYFTARKAENFLLSNLDWNKVSPVEVGQFLGFDVKCIPEGTQAFD